MEIEKSATAVRAFEGSSLTIRLWVGLVSLLAVMSCEKSEFDHADSPVKLLRNHIESSIEFQNSGWTLRDVFRTNDRLSAVFDFPSASQEGRARYAPVFSELVRICPVVDRDAYWQSRHAKPITLYLSRPGKQGAEAMAVCNRQFDQATFERLTNPQLLAEEPLLQLPPMDSDVVALNKALDEGSPSFNDAYAALQDNDLAALQEILFSRPELVSRYSGNGRTLLFEANRPSEVTILIAFGANPNVSDVDGISALEWISRFERNLKSVRRLIDMGAAARHVHPEYAGSPEIAAALLDHGAVISDNSLYAAIREGLPGVADFLYERGAHLDKTNVEDYPLHAYVRWMPLESEANLPNALEKFEDFVRFGADIHSKNEQGLTPLELAMQEDEWHGKQLLVERLNGLGHVE